MFGAERSKLPKKKRVVFLFALLAAFTSIMSGVIVFGFLENKFKDKEKVDNQSISNPNLLSLKPTATLTPTISPTPTPNIFQGLPADKFYITYYGYPDNDPPGRSIAYPKSRYKNSLHQEAGGIGTYQNPITFAAAKNSILIGTIYYVPYIQKYIILEDVCASCNRDGTHIDIWLESNESFEGQVINCEGKWTRQSADAITKPTPNLPVNTSPLFNKTSGECTNY